MHCRLTCVLGLALLLAGMGCRQAEHVEHGRIRIGIQDNAVTGLIRIAQGRGFFKKHGLDVVVQPYPSGKLALQGLFKGDVETAACADMPVMANSFTRNDFKVFATVARTQEGGWIIARKDAGIARPEDLKGKRLATQKNSAVHFFLSSFLLHYEIPAASVDLSYLPALELPAALAEGRIDAFSMRNPFIAEARALLGDNAIEFHDTSVYLQSFTLVAQPDYLKQNHGKVLALLKALVEAEQLLAAHPDEAMGVAIAQYGAERDAEIRADWPSYTYEVGLDQSLVLTLEDQAKWAMDTGLVPSGPVPNFLEFIYPAALLEVKPGAVTLMGHPDMHHRKE